MFADIIKNIKNGTIIDILKKWILEIIEKMEKQPKGKKITVFASTSTLKDYKTGLIQAGHKNVGKTIILVFDKYLSQTISIQKNQKIDMSLKKISVEKSQHKRRVKDREDEKFLVLSEAIIKMDKWKNYEIIFATKDNPTGNTIKDIFTKHKETKRLHVVTNLKLFEKLIEC